jgi:hypothetical protein
MRRRQGGADLRGAMMSWSNCMFFAVRLCIRRARKGDRGDIVIRKSRLGMGPHFLYWHRRRRLISFVPHDAKVKNLPPPLFRRHVRWGE